MKAYRRRARWLVTLLWLGGGGAFAQTAPPPAADLVGTSWQLVKFQGSDDKTLLPDIKAKYTIEFAADGLLTARIDCNRGHGTWTSPGQSRLQLGPLAITRALCAEGSLHDQIVRDLPFVRSYVIKNGHLILSMSDGGTYEFEPMGGSTSKSQRSPRARAFRSRVWEVGA